MAGDGGAIAAAPVDDEIVTLGLAADGLVDGGDERLVAFAGAQGCAQIGIVVDPTMRCLRRTVRFIRRTNDELTDTPAGYSFRE